MRSVAANTSPPERVAASASPIQSEQVETIPLTLSVQLLTQPNERGNLRLEAPADLIGEDAFFALRYFVNGRARRAVVQALRVTGAGGGRDIVTVRIISDTAVQQREARRSTLGITARARRVSDDPVEAVRDLEVELVDASRTGLGFDSRCRSCTATGSCSTWTWWDRSRAGRGRDRPPRRPARDAVRRAVRRPRQGGPFFARVLDAVWNEPSAHRAGRCATPAQCRRGGAPEGARPPHARVRVAQPVAGEGVAARVAGRRRADLRDHREQQIADAREVLGEHLQHGLVGDRRAVVAGHADVVVGDQRDVGVAEARARARASPPGSRSC